MLLAESPEHFKLVGTWLLIFFVNDSSRHYFSLNRGGIKEKKDPPSRSASAANTIGIALLLSGDPGTENYAAQVPDHPN